MHNISVERNNVMSHDNTSEQEQSLPKSQIKQSNRRQRSDNICKEIFWHNYVNS